MQGFKEDQIGVERYLNLRYDGTDVPVMTPFAGNGNAEPAKAFEEQYKREFGFVLEVCNGVYASYVSDSAMHAKLPPSKVECLSYSCAEAWKPAHDHSPSQRF